jgi:hypothetical protein
MVMKTAAVSSCNLAVHIAKRCVRVVFFFGMTVLLISCSTPLAQLPDLAYLPDKTLNSDQQQIKISEMAAKGQAHQSETAKAIESEK